MKHYLLSVLALFAVACAGTDDQPEPINYGTLEQPVYVPGGYGIEGVTNWQGHPDFGLRCSGSIPADVADNWCSMPDSKSIVIGFQAGTCDSLMQAAAVDAYNFWVAEVTGAGFTVTTGNTFQMKCGSIAGTTVLGKFTSGPSWDQIGASYGTLGQYKNGFITMDQTDINAWAQSLAPGSATARHNIKRNLWLHELFHLVGLAHSHNGTGPELLSEKPDGTWVNAKQITQTEWNMLDCYNPANGGLFDDC